MRIPDPKANTTTEAYLAYKAGYLEESELKPILYEPYLHFDAWLAYWAGLTYGYPLKEVGKNLFSSPIVIGGWVANGAELNSNKRFKSKNKMSVSSGSSYIISGSPKDDTKTLNITVQAYASDGSIIRQFPSSSTWGDVPLSFTAPDGCAYITISGRYSDDTELGVLGQETDVFQNAQLEVGSTATAYEPYTGEPELLTDEEALVAYLSGVTNTYPEEIKDPYDVRIVGYLKYLVSARWGRPEYPVNNEEFYLSTMEPTHTSNPEPSADIELDTAEGKIINVEAYGDTYQQTYSGKNLLLPSPKSSASSGLTASYDATTGVVTLSGTASNNWSNAFNDVAVNLPAGTYTFSATTEAGLGRNIIFFNGSTNILQKGLSATATSVECIVPQAITSLRLWLSPTNGTNYTGKTFKAQLEIGSQATSFEPYVGGIPAPNPDYPQDIDVVTGEQTVEVHGKNIVRISTYEISGTNYELKANLGNIKLSSTTTNNSFDLNAGTRTGNWLPTYGQANDYHLTMLGGSYIMSVQNFINRSAGSGNTVLQIFTNKRTINRSIATDDTYVLPFSIVLDDDEYIKSIYIWTPSGATVDMEMDIQLEEGSTATAYEPYQSQSYTISLTGKNLFNVSATPTYTNGVSVTGSLTVTATSSGTNKYALYRLVEAKNYVGSKVCVSCSTMHPSSTNDARIEIGLCNADGTSKTPKAYTNNVNVKPSFTVTDDPSKPYIYVALYASYSSSASVGDYVGYGKVMVNRGSTPGAYASYSPIELCKIGTYQDYIYQSEGDWYVHKDTGKQVLNGTENIYNKDTSSGFTRIHFSLTEQVNVGNVRNATLRSDYFNASVDNNYGTAFLNNARTYAYPQSTITTVEEFKTWLSTHNTTFYYPLATPTDTKITDATLIGQLEALAGADTYNEKTYIKVTANDPNLPAILKVEAYKY